MDRCQINRNTFYYHFHDIPELLELSIKRDLDNIIKTYSRLGSPRDCLEPLVKHSISHQRAILHIYHSLHREVFLNEMDRITLYLAAQYVETAIASKPAVSEADRKLLTRFCKCMLVGIFLDWLNRDMSYDLLSSFDRICELLSDSGNLVFFRPADGGQ